MSPYPADPEWARGPMRLVMTTYPNRERALSAVEGALARHLAACGNVVPIDSRYWWNGRVESETEALVLLKTVPKRVGALFRFLAEDHPYSVPEVVELDVPRVAPGYLAYLTETLDRSSIPAAGGGAATRPAVPPAPAGRRPGRTRGRPHHRSTRTGSRR